MSSMETDLTRKRKSYSSLDFTCQLLGGGFNFGLSAGAILSSNHKNSIMEASIYPESLQIEESFGGLEMGGSSRAFQSKPSINFFIRPYPIIKEEGLKFKLRVERRSKVKEGWDIPFNKTINEAISCVILDFQLF